MDEKLPKPNSVNERAKPNKTSGKRSLYANDYLTLIFSCVAVIVSLLSFYFTNIKVDNQASASVVSISKNPDSVRLDLVFVNTGNRPVVVLRPDVYYTNNNPKHLESSFGESVRIDNQFPLVIEPHEIKLV